MHDQRLKLKIKLKALAAEARIIRAEELKLTKWKSDGKEFDITSRGRMLRTKWKLRRGLAQAPGANELREALYEHRTRDIRLEARATLLAYGFIRGKTYRSIERNPRPLPEIQRIHLWDRVEKIIKKYGAPGALGEASSILKDWIEQPEIPVVDLSQIGQLAKV